MTDFNIIAKKWQEKWEDSQIFKVKEDINKNNNNSKATSKEKETPRKSLISRYTEWLFPEKSRFYTLPEKISELYKKLWNYGGGITSNILEKLKLKKRHANNNLQVSNEKK